MTSPKDPHTRWCLPFPSSAKDLDTGFDEFTRLYCQLAEEMKIRVGDIVKLKTGNSPIRVLSVGRMRDVMYSKDPSTRWYATFTTAPKDLDTPVIEYVYLSAEGKAHDERRWRTASHFEHHPDYPLKIEDIQMTQKLYKTADGKYGTFLTKDSSGNMVLELKGGGGVAAYAPEDIEEVLPYTVAVIPMGHNGDNEGTRHYAFKKGAVRKGDVLMQISTTNLFEVTELDSKCATPRASRNGFIVLGAVSDRVMVEK